MDAYGNLIVFTPKDVLISSHKIKIAQMLADDISKPEICKAMNLHSKTIDSHVMSMKKAFGLHTTAALIYVLYRKGAIK